LRLFSFGGYGLALAALALAALALVAFGAIECPTCDTITLFFPIQSTTLSVEITIIFCRLYYFLATNTFF